MCSEGLPSLHVPLESLNPIPLSSRLFQSYRGLYYLHSYLSILNVIMRIESLQSRTVQMSVG
jgi:hypothetical protein